MIILCPKCGNKVLVHDKKTELPLEAVCRKCNKLVTYYPTEETIVLRRVPERKQSSGLRFW